MKIVVSGGTGFIGAQVVANLVAAGHETVVLTRDPARVRTGRGVSWHPPERGPWTSEVATADAVVNLAGESIGDGRWTAARKARLVSSRLDATSALVDAILAAPRDRVFVSASAVGFYGFDSGDELFDEGAPRGRGFLAELCEQWEGAAHLADGAARVVILRLGVVIGPGGGALAKMLPPFRLGAGGPIGSGKQWMSWVSRDDAVRAIEWVLRAGPASATYNVTSPEPVRSVDFAHALGRALHRPAVIPTPGFALRVAFGQMAEEALLGGQRVIPRRLEEAGFRFAAPGIAQALQLALER